MKRRLSVLVVLGVLTACGSGSKEASPSSDSSDSTDSTLEQDTTEQDTTEQDTTEQDTTEQDASGDPASPGDSDEGAVDGDTIEPPDDDGDPANDLGNDVRIEPDDDSIVIDDLDDLPAECRQIMGDFLREIEPIVNAIDWQTATMASLETLDTTFGEPSDRLDAAMAASGCDRYDFGPENDTDLEFTIELAKAEVPGVVTWLEFIRDLDATGAPEGVPTDCEGAIAFVDELIERTSGMSELPITQFAGITSAMSTIQIECPTERSTAFFDDSTFQAWATG
jgi:hypothetical protein